MRVAVVCNRGDADAAATLFAGLGSSAVLPSAVAAVVSVTAVTLRAVLRRAVSSGSFDVFFNACDGGGQHAFGIPLGGATAAEGRGSDPAVTAGDAAAVLEELGACYTGVAARWHRHRRSDIRMMAFYADYFTPAHAVIEGPVPSSLGAAAPPAASTDEDVAVSVPTALARRLVADGGSGAVAALAAIGVRGAVRVASQRIDDDASVAPQTALRCGDSVAAAVAAVLADVPSAVVEADTRAEARAAAAAAAASAGTTSVSEVVVVAWATGYDATTKKARSAGTALVDVSRGVATALDVAALGDASLVGALTALGRAALLSMGPMGVGSCAVQAFVAPPPAPAAAVESASTSESAASAVTTPLAVSGGTLDGAPVNAVAAAKARLTVGDVLMTAPFRLFAFASGSVADCLAEQCAVARTAFLASPRGRPVYAVGFDNTNKGYFIRAARAIKKGELVYDEEGKPVHVITKPFVDAHWSPEERLTFSRFAWPLDSGGHVYAIWDDDPKSWRPVNHSCDPNVVFDAPHSLNAVASRDIPAGEDLTLDYATFCDFTMKPFQCFCRTTQCRGLIKPDEATLAKYGGNAFHRHQPIDPDAATV